MKIPTTSITPTSNAAIAAGAPAPICPLFSPETLV
jgi:hypothetical protein